MKAEYLDHFGDDKMVVNAARTSFDTWKDEFDEKDAKLIHYLAKHKHNSPFFHPQVQWRFTAPIFVARQWFRHNVGCARSEVSRRYVDTPPTYFEPEEWRARPEKSIKQGSGEPIAAQRTAAERFATVRREAEFQYSQLLELGVAPEQARMILPQAMETTWVETGSLFFYANLCRERLAPNAQKEIRDLALDVNTVMAQLFPVSWLALMEATNELPK